MGSRDDVERRARFFAFLDRIQKRTAGLFILGDLFEFGFEYRQGLLAPGAAIAQQIGQLANSGVMVTLVTGNHDCWLGTQFAERYRIRVEPKPLTISLDGLRCFLAHGDELDHSFLNRVSRRLFRSRIARQGYSLLPQQLGYRLACSVARRTRPGVDNPELAEVFAQFAARKLETGYQAVILGHLHQPVLRRVGSGWYLNTGDWVRHYSYGVLEQGRLRLEYWQD